jgi:hypothetical protein
LRYNKKATCGKQVALVLGPGGPCDLCIYMVFLSVRAVNPEKSLCQTIRSPLNRRKARNSRELASKRTFTDNSQRKRVMEGRLHLAQAHLSHRRITCQTKLSVQAKPMSNDEFLDKQFELSVAAGMDQRYHQKYANFWWRWDTSAKVATAIAAVASAILSVATATPEPNGAMVSFSVALSIVAAFTAVALNVIPFGTWEQQHRDFLRQWTDLREETEALKFKCGNGPPSEDIVCDLQKLDAKFHRICGQEPSPNEELIKQCFEAEKKSRGLSQAA